MRNVQAERNGFQKAARFAHTLTLHKISILARFLAFTQTNHMRWVCNSFIIGRGGIGSSRGHGRGGIGGSRVQEIVESHSTQLLFPFFACRWMLSREYDLKMRV